MGFSPAQVGQMTPWEFMACLEGFGRAYGWKPGGGGGAADAITDEQVAALGIEGF